MIHVEHERPMNDIQYSMCERRNRYPTPSPTRTWTSFYTTSSKYGVNTAAKNLYNMADAET